MQRIRPATDVDLHRLLTLLGAVLAVYCLLSSSDPCHARAPAQPSGPAATSRGSEVSPAGLTLGVIPWEAYAAAVAVIFGGTALFVFVSLRRDAQERIELLGRKELDLLSQHAEALAALYERYGKRFRTEHLLWDALVADERKHSRWIGEFAQRMRGGEARLCRELFPYGRVSNALDQVHQLTRDAAHPDLTATAALQNALLLENERSEWRLPDLFTLSSDKFGTTLDLLQSEALAHQRALSGAIGKS